MHLALLIDEERLKQEQSMLNRLCIGLMAEGVRITRIVPDNVPAALNEIEQRIAIARRIEVPMRVLPWMRRARANRLAEQLEKSIPDAIWATGSQAWPIAIELAEMLQRPALIDVASMRQARQAPHPNDSPAIVCYTASGSAIAQRLSQRVDGSLIHIVPIGVAVPPYSRTLFEDPERPAAIAILGESQQVKAYESVFQGLAKAAEGQIEFQAFLELRGSSEHEIWRRAERLNLLRFISIIGEATLYRPLITRCDVVLIPEDLGTVRSILLEAMAYGIPVVAKDNPALEMLQDGETALLVRNSDAKEWAEKLNTVLTQKDLARRIGGQARAVVTSNYRSSDQVARMVEILQGAVSGGVYRLVTTET